MAFHVKERDCHQHPYPTESRQVREFLGSMAFCRLWIPGFAEIAKPFCLATKEAKEFGWAQEHQRDVEKMKHALLLAPVLGYQTLLSHSICMLMNTKEKPKGS